MTTLLQLGEGEQKIAMPITNPIHVLLVLSSFPIFTIPWRNDYATIQSRETAVRLGAKDVKARS